MKMTAAMGEPEGCFDQGRAQAGLPTTHLPGLGVELLAIRTFKPALFCGRHAWVDSLNYLTGEYIRP